MSSTDALKIAYIGGGSRELARNKELAFQADFTDPASHLPIDAAREMFSQMPDADRDYLPGWN